MNQSLQKPAQGASQNRTPAPAPSGGAFRPFEGLRQEIDRLFDDFGRDWRMPIGRAISGLGFTDVPVPAVDVVEKDDCFELSAELPGMDEKNTDLKLANGQLVIRGEKKDEREEKSKGSYISERRYGSFERSFALPDDIDASKIEANFVSGVLKVRLPKKPDAQKPEQKIDIKTS
jgi:HSP20 family protein